ncbi:pentatricopeptide repeat-containing protein [Carex littledalei]|uniref:Pentatricopeptide repeat-containing protein n=1 Tax=Carex littledalei TaxID=544730 RepID=A0A833VI87_9POAL|nr:pentatricopeptide repeat-containing protein [Carex littledalei]
MLVIYAGRLSPSLQSNSLLSATRLLCFIHGASPRILKQRRQLSPSRDVARSNHVISVLSRECRMTEAHKVFDEMLQRDVISWTALISGYVRSGMLHQAQLLFDRSDSMKDVVTWTALLSGYLKSKMIKEAEDLFASMPDKNLVTWNTMMQGYIESGLIDKACKFFQKMPVRNVVSYNTLLTGLMKVGFIDQACRMFHQMPERNVISWTTVITGLVQAGHVNQARELFNKMPDRNVVSWNVMFSAYAQNGQVNEALELFNKMPVRNIPSWNGMITGLVQNRQVDQAKELFDEMPERNVVSWTSMISGYVQLSMNEMALILFCEMLQDGNCRPNQATFVSVLDAISNKVALIEGRQLHQVIIKSQLEHNPFVGSSLINMYAKCGEIGIAREVFDLSSQRDLVSWNGIIAAYAHHGNGREAINLYKEMKAMGFKPNDVTYVSLLSACSHAGLVDAGLMIFNSMVRDKSVVVREEHYTCLMDLCGRSGRLDDAKTIINGLKIRSLSGFTLGAFLNGCSLHGEADVGKLVEDKLLEVEPNNSGTYTQLSNIYASAGKYKEAAKIRQKMIDRGLKKQPGCSWIEVGNRVHVFVARDVLHSESESIYGLLHDIHDMIRRAGCDMEGNRDTIDHGI